MNARGSSTALFAGSSGVRRPAPPQSPTSEVFTRANPADYPDWDGLWASHPHYSSGHGAAWARVLVSTYGHEPHYLIGGGDSPQSLLPLMEVNSWPTGRRGVALPFLDQCEPLYPDAGSGRNLMQAAIEYGRTRAWNYLEFRGGRSLFDGIPAAVSYYAHTLNLAEEEGRLFAGLTGPVRRALRRAGEAGVTVAVARSPEAVRTFYGLYCKTRRRHGLPPQPFAFFSNIQKHLLSRGEGAVVLASHQGRAVAAGIFFHLHQRALFKYGASDEAFQHLRGNNLVMWEAIKWLRGCGAKTLHFGRTSLANQGLRRFKLGWGVREEMLEYAKYDYRQNRFVPDTDASAGWHNRVFRVMPPSLARMTGAMLYRYWA